MAGLPQGWVSSSVTEQEKAMMLRSASMGRTKGGQPTPFTVAGRELTKHPHIVRLGEADDLSFGKLMKQFGGETGINKAAAEWIANVIENGACIRRVDPGKGNVVEFYDSAPKAISPQTNGVRFSGACLFACFLGRP